MNIKKMNLTELTNDEMQNTEGGFGGWIIAAALVIGIIIGYSSHDKGETVEVVP